MPWLIKRFLNAGAVLLLFVVVVHAARAQDITVNEGTPISLIANSNPGAPDTNGFSCGTNFAQTCYGGTFAPNGNINWTVDGVGVGSTYDTINADFYPCAQDDSGHDMYCGNYWDESGYTAVLPAGWHTITASISSAQDPYAAFTSTWTVNVISTKTAPSISVSCSPNPITYGSQNTTCTASQSAGTGSLNWTINGGNWTTTGINGSAGGFAGWSPGTYTIGVTYSGDNDYSSVSASTALSIVKATPNVSVSLSPSNINYGDSFTATVHVDCNTNCGNVDFRFDGAEWGTVPLDQNGNFSAQNSSHDAGSHTIQINYLGNDSYNPASGAATLSVNKSTPSLSMSCSPNPLSFGYQDTTCTASQPYGTGTLNWFINGNTWTSTGVNGSALGFAGIPAGNYTVSVSYSGDGNANSTNASTVLTVNPGGSAQEMTVTSGTPVSLVAYSNNGAPDQGGFSCGTNFAQTCYGGTVPPNGTITWLVDGVSTASTYDTVDATTYACAVDDSGHEMSCFNYFDESGYTATLPLGTHTVTALISSSQDPYAAFIATWLVHVVQPTPSISVSCAPNPIAYGSQNTTCTASQSGGTGSLNWTINGGNWTNTGVNGSAGGFAGWSAGNYTIGVEYSGDTTYAPASASTVLTIDKATPNVAVSLSPSSISYGDSFTASVHVDCNTNCGDVDFRFDGAEWGTVSLDQNGNFSAPNTSHGIGTHTIQINYLGDSNHNPSSGSAVLTVGKITPSLTVSCTPNSIFVGLQDTTCTASQSGGTGTLTWSINGSPWTTTGVNGTAGGSIDSSAGNYTIYVTYSGDDSYNSSSAATTVTIKPLSASATVYSYAIKDGVGNSGFSSNGNVVAYTDSIGGVWTLSYDNLSRLSSAVQTPPGQQPQNYCWSYDSFGNRTLQAQSSQPFANGDCVADPNGATIWATYDTSNRVLSSNSGGSVAQPLYDDAGNTAYDGTNGYLYDAEGRVCAVKTSPISGGVVMTQYLYNASGQRVAKGSISVWNCDATTNGFTATNQYVLGPAGEQLTELDGSGNFIHTNVFAGGSLIATDDASGVHFQLSDWLGTKRVQSNANGVSEQTCFNRPFGDAQPCVGATEQFFTGKERDTESGLDYMTARYYAATMGRFVSADPLQFNELRLLNAQRWNMYAYAINNPLSFTDPDGRDAIAVNFGADVGGLGHMGILSVHANGSATYSRFGPQHPGSPADVGQVRTTTDLPKVQFDSKGNPTEASYRDLTAAVAKFEDNYTGPVKMFHYKTSEAETAALDAYIKAAQAASDAHQLNYVGPFSTCVTYCMIGLHRAGVDRAALLGLHPGTMIPNYFAYLMSTNADSQHGEKVTSRIIPDSIVPVQ